MLAGALAVHLWPEWVHDPDLSHGILMPATCALLLYLSGRSGAWEPLKERRAALTAGGLGAAALATLWVAGLRPSRSDWSSPVVSFALAVSLALMGCGALAAFAGGATARVPLNWTSLCAALLWPLCSPMPPGTYARLALNLQLWVTTTVMHSLDFLGVAARRQGNIIELARGTVGIEEACSGVRSLISCVFAAILFSAALVRKPGARVLLVALSVPLALVMNIVRSLLLTLLVNAGIRVEGTWHDLTGYAVLLLTAAALLGLAIRLDGPANPAPAARSSGVAIPPSDKSRAQGVFSIFLGATVATIVFFAAQTSTSPIRDAAVPDLSTMLPPSAVGWQVVTRGDLYRFAGVLRTDHLEQRTYFRQDEKGSEQVTLYLAYWPAGQASAGVVGSHTPDACWPGAGWAQEKVPDENVSLELAGRRLPEAQHRLFVNEGYPSTSGSGRSLTGM